MQIVSACLARDLPVYRVTARSLRAHVPGAELHVVTRKEDFGRFREACGNEVQLWDEAELVPGMTLPELGKLPQPYFPKGAGWYFQQFLKFAFERVSNNDEYFLIWDADTVLLRPIEFFSADGRPYYTRASEHHLPYFQTFRALFGEDAPREFSFISQHQIVRKSTLRSMLSEIETRHPGSRNWAWAIMNNLRGEGSNRFSEYETYGHYLKLRYPEDFVARDLRWTRHGERRAGYPPVEAKLPLLASDHDFAAFEAFFSVRNRLKRYLLRMCGKATVTDYPK